MFLYGRDHEDNDDENDDDDVNVDDGTENEADAKKRTVTMETIIGLKR